MNCPHCSHEGVPDGGRFCPECGQRLYVMAGLDYTGLITERTEGFVDREWVFRALNDWLANPQGARNFLVAGWAGTGKSAIAARFVQMSRREAPVKVYPHLAQADLVFYHFCQNRYDATVHPLRFVKALSLELAREYPPFAQALLDVWKRENKIDVDQQVGTVAPGGTVVGVRVEHLHIDLAPAEAFDLVVRQPLQQLCRDGFGATILLLVDGLDEAWPHSTPGGGNLVTLLSDVTDHPEDLPPNVRLLLTSRPDPRVIHTLGEPDLDLIKHAPDDVDDVQLYAHGRLDRLPEPGRSTLAQRIAEIGKGNFLYARYFLDDLPPGVEEMEDLSALPLPKDLYAIYREFLERELARPPLERWDERYGPLLGIMAVARGRGLTRLQLLGITGLPDPRLDSALRACRQYLTNGTKDGPFRIYHHSFRSFLLGEDGADEPEYRVYPGMASQGIADYFLKVYEGEWHRCQNEYALSYTPTHLAEAIEHTEEPLRRKEQVEKLAILLEDFCFLETKAGHVSIDDLLADLRAATAFEWARTGSPVDLSDVLKVLNREGPNLTGWDQEQRPAFFAQQVLNRSKDMRLHSLARVAKARLKELGFPYFELRWRTGPLDAEEKRYYSTFSFWNADTVSSLAVTPGGHLAVSAHLDGSLKVWDLATGRKVRTLTGHAGMVLAVAVTPDGLHAVSGSQDGTLKVWDLKTGRVKYTLVGHEGTVFTVRITPDGQRAVSRADDGLVRVWDLNSGQSLHALGKPKRPYYFGPALEEDGMEYELPELYYGISEYALAVTPDSRRAIAAFSGGFQWDGTLPGDDVKVWDLETGLEVYSLGGHSGQVLSIIVSPDGRWTVSGSGDGTVKVWDLETGRLARTLNGHSDRVQAVLMTVDGRQVISASLDRTVKVWDLGTGELLRTLIGHGGELYALTSSADGQHVISASFQGILTLWNVQCGQEIASVVVEGERPQIASIQQRHMILAGTGEGDVHCLSYVDPKE